MKYTNKTLCPACLWLATIAGAGCQMPVKTTSVSDPPSQTLTRPDYTIDFEPVKRGRPAFEAFRFTLANRSPETIRIDWHETLYLLNGRPSCMFVSRDTEPGRVKDPEKRYEIVAPGMTHSKEIAPLKHIAYVPAKYSKRAPQDAPPFRAGPIPPGRSGIRLSFMQGDRGRSEEISLNIIEVEVE